METPGIGRSNFDLSRKNEIEAVFSGEIDVFCRIGRCFEALGRHDDGLPAVDNLGEYQMKLGATVEMAGLPQVENAARSLVPFSRSVFPSIGASVTQSLGNNCAQSHR